MLAHQSLAKYREYRINPHTYNQMNLMGTNELEKIVFSINELGTNCTHVQKNEARAQSLTNYKNQLKTYFTLDLRL